MMLFDQRENAPSVIAGIDDDRFAGFLVANDMAVALQHANRKDFVDESLWLLHTVHYSIRAFVERSGRAGFRFVCSAAAFSAANRRTIRCDGCRAESRGATFRP